LRSAGLRLLAAAALATSANRQRHGLRIHELIEGADNLIDYLTKSFFEAVNEWLLGTLLGFVHAVRLLLSMGDGESESTAGGGLTWAVRMAHSRGTHAGPSFAVPLCDRTPAGVGVLHTCMFI
jgi:hypothetical protein